MKLTIRKALDLFSGLRALDGYDKVLKSGTEEKTAKVPYTLKGKVRMKIRKNLIRLTPDIDTYNDALRAKFDEISGGRNRMDPADKEDAAKIALVNSETEIMLNGETDDMNLVLLTEADLDLDKNPIPGSVLAALDPVIDDKDDEPKEE